MQIVFYVGPLVKEEGVDFDRRQSMSESNKSKRAYLTKSEEKRQTAMNMLIPDSIKSLSPLEEKNENNEDVQETTADNVSSVIQMPSAAAVHLRFSSYVQPDGYPSYEKESEPRSSIGSGMFDGANTTESEGATGGSPVFAPTQIKVVSVASADVELVELTV